VAAVGLDADGTGGEGDPVPVLALFRETRETDAAARACPGTGGLPVPVAVDRGLDAVGERLGG
jgi:hypothetical protein